MVILVGPCCLRLGLRERHSLYCPNAPNALRPCHRQWAMLDPQQGPWGPVQRGKEAATDMLK